MMVLDHDSYVFLIERGERNFGAYAPDLPGCVAVGDSLAETEERMREAIALHLDLMRQRGDEIPEPTIAAAAAAPRG